MLFRFLLLWASHPSIVTEATTERPGALGGSGQSDGSAALGSPSGSGGPAPMVAGPQRRWPVLRQPLGGVEKPAPCLHPSRGQHGAACDPSCLCPAPSAFPQPAAMPQLGPEQRRWCMILPTKMALSATEAA